MSWPLAPISNTFLDAALNAALNTHIIHAENVQSADTDEASEIFTLTPEFKSLQQRIADVVNALDKDDVVLALKRIERLLIIETLDNNTIDYINNLAKEAVLRLNHQGHTAKAQDYVYALAL